MAGVSNESSQIIETSQGVGERLRLAREAKNFSISDVASQLKFTKDMIIHMENQQWNKLHGRTYARGYFSSYVNLLDMPRNEMLVAFNIEYKSTPSNLIQSQFNLTKKNQFSWILILFVVISIVITSFAYIKWQQFQDTTQDTLTSNSSWGESEGSESKFGAVNDSAVVKPIRTENLTNRTDGEILSSNKLAAKAKSEPGLEPMKINKVMEDFLSVIDGIPKNDSLDNEVNSASML